MQISYFYLLPSGSAYTDNLLITLGSVNFNPPGSSFTFGSGIDISTPADLENMYNSFVTNYAAIFAASPYNITVTVVTDYTNGLPALCFEGENVGEAFALSSTGGLQRIDTTQLATPTVTISTSYKCIGSYEDTKDDKIYYFVTTTAPADAFLNHILEYDLQTNSINTVFRDTGEASTSLFKWNPSYLITEINKIGDVLYWTQDRYGEPKSINVKKAKKTFTSFNASGAAGT